MVDNSHNIESLKNLKHLHLSIRFPFSRSHNTLNWNANRCTFQIFHSLLHSMQERKNEKLCPEVSLVCWGGFLKYIGWICSSFDRHLWIPRRKKRITRPSMPNVYIRPDTEPYTIYFETIHELRPTSTPLQWSRQYIFRQISIFIKYIEKIFRNKPQRTHLFICCTIHMKLHVILTCCSKHVKRCQ